MMQTAAQTREHQQHIDQVCDFMRRHRLSLDDLIDIGGEDLCSSDPGRTGKARCVEKCWGLMARLGVKPIDLQDTAGQSPDSSARRQRHRKPIEKHQQNQCVEPKQLVGAKSFKINDLAISGPVGDPQLNLDINDAVAAGATP
jgi:hypothetical protein